MTIDLRLGVIFIAIHCIMLLKPRSRDPINKISDTMLELSYLILGAYFLNKGL